MGKIAMSETDIEIGMDATSLYREEVYTDRKMASLRIMTPVNPDGSTDLERQVLYVGQAQIMTPMGAIPLVFEIDASSLAEAVEKYPEHAKASVEKTMEELKEMRRQAASSIVLPEAGGGPVGGMPGGGKIQIP